MTGFLLWLWGTAALFTGLAVATMALLVAARLLRARAEAAREAQRRKLHLLLLRVSSGEVAAARALASRRTNLDLLAEIAVEFAALVRGAEMDRLRDALISMGLERRLRQRARRGGVTRKLVAVEALSLFPSPATTGCLLTCTQDRRAEVRVAALRALAALGEAPSLSAMLAALCEGGGEPSAALGDLLARAGPSHWEAMRSELLDPASPPQVRVAVAGALSSAGDYAALPALSRAAGDENVHVRAAAVHGMGVLGHPDCKPLLSLALADAEWEVRAAAAAAIGRAGLTGLAGALQRRLADEVWFVRFKAAGALALLGDVGRLRLETSSRSDEDVVKRSAALALLELQAA